MARTATWPEQSPAVRPGSDGRAEADQPPTLGVGGRISYQAFDVGSTDSRGVECLAVGGTRHRRAEQHLGQRSVANAVAISAERPGRRGGDTHTIEL